MAEEGIGGNAVAGMNVGHAAEEGSILGHGIIYPRSIEDSRAQAAKDGYHYGHSNEETDLGSKKLGRGKLSYTDNPFHLIHRQSQNINEVHQKINYRHAERSQEQAERDVALRVFNLFCRAVHRIPAVVCPENRDERQAKEFQAVEAEARSSRKKLTKAMDAGFFSKSQTEEDDAGNTSYPQKSE